MKRRIALSLWLIAAGSPLALAACGPGEGDKAQAPVEGGSQDQGWAAPPTIQSASLEGGALVIRGAAPPDGRVVLRGAAGAGFAAAADEAGRFEIRIPRPTGHMIFTPELQLGQDAAEAPDSLALIDGGQGAAALLRTGAPARRLDGAGLLGAVDSDGRAVVAGGRAPAGAATTLQIDGRTVTAAVGRDGRWSALLGPAGGPMRITVGGRTYLYPGGGGAGPLAERAGTGWRVRWTAAGGAAQVTWLPDRD